MSNAKMCESFDELHVLPDGRESASSSLRYRSFCSTVPTVTRTCDPSVLGTIALIRMSSEESITHRSPTDALGDVGQHEVAVRGKDSNSLHLLHRWYSRSPRADELA